MTEYSNKYYDDSNVFTEEEIQFFNKRALEEYEAKYLMTPAEKRALRKWVASGHSVYEHPGSRYICLFGAYPPRDFLDVYRMDREIKQALKGKSRIEREQYLKEYISYSDPPEETPESVAWTHLPEPIKDRIRKIEREVFYLSMFIAREGLWNESQEFLNDNMDNPIPFELEW